MKNRLFSQDKAKKALESKQKQGQSFKHGTPSKTSSIPLRLSNAPLGVKKSIHFLNNKGKDVETSSKGKKRNNFESDNDHDCLQRTWIKKVEGIE